MEEQAQIIFGRRSVLEAILAGRNFDRIIIGKDLKGDAITEIKNAARKAKIMVQLVPMDTLDKELSKLRLRDNSSHQGVIGFTSLIEYTEIEKLLDLLAEKGKEPLLLMLEGVTDVMNFGAIARSAECLGADGIIIPDKNFARLNHDALKSSAGALTRIPVCRDFSLRRVCSYLKARGLRVLGSSLQANKEIHFVDLKGPCCIIMGAEGGGISAELYEKCDADFIIPMVGKTASLNVSVSAGIVLYEAMMQRIK